MDKITWVAEPVTKEDKIKQLIIELVNEIEKEYGERYLTVGSARIEQLVKDILSLNPTKRRKD